MKILVAIPCLDQVDTSFVRCLLSLQMQGECFVQLAQGSLVYDARNQLCKQALENDMDYIFWLDSDMVFQPDLLKRMIESIGDKEILTALCFRRRHPYLPCIYDELEYKINDDGVGQPYAHPFQDIPKEMTEVAACGFACVLMKTSVIRKMIERNANSLPFSPLLGFGEDFTFCLNARRAGVKIWCDPNISIGHLAQVTITRESYEAMKQQGVENAQ